MDITVSTANNGSFSQGNVTRPSLLLFVGSDRAHAALVYCILSVSSIILHAIFIAGIRKLCGWKSNFCFTLLLTVSAMCMVRFIAEIIGSLTALFYMSWDESQNLGITLGSLAWSPYFTVIILNIVITAHRLAYTAFPFTAGQYLNKTVTQITLAAVLLLFLGTVVALHTSLLGFRWVDGLMSYIVMQSRNPYLFFILNSVTNYFVGIINLTAYSLLFFMLWRKKLISFSRNREMKMTLQVLCMVVCEVLFFLYWEFVHVNVSDTWDIVLAEISNLLYFDVLVIPYLVLNRMLMKWY
ncbi:hypothetical protein Y032_0328g2643 [Ancylostoma ceylanicum]|uniref:Serpentine receptor class gamma n=1 Tax=Ancylostoma ceylanicum TaxID=53326 RepID=A0A016RZM5_9BILA|nr:hypothetical protein Y032_0328g2643 [Ancylostoma ceylanicum]